MLKKAIMKKSDMNSSQKLLLFKLLRSQKIYKYQPMALEIVAFITLATCSFLLLAYSLKWYLPGIPSIKFISGHYIYPVAISILIVLSFNLRSGAVDRQIYQMLRTILSISIILYCHFNLKLWSAIINKNQ